MTREEAEKLKIFQIVRWNVPEENCASYAVPYSGKLGIVTEKILWEDGGEEIHLRFPEKRFNQQIFYSSIDDLLYDFNAGHDITFDEGFDTGANCIDWIDYE